MLVPAQATAVRQLERTGDQVLIFFVGPVILTFIFSFTNLALTGAEASQLRFIGFENFVRMFNDPAFPSADFGKNKVVEAHAAIEYFSKKHEKQYELHWQ